MTKRVGDKQDGFELTFKLDLDPGNPLKGIPRPGGGDKGDALWGPDTVTIKKSAEGGVDVLFDNEAAKLGQLRKLHFENGKVEGEVLWGLVHKTLDQSTSQLLLTILAQGLRQVPVAQAVQGALLIESAIPRLGQGDGAAKAKITAIKERALEKLAALKEGNPESFAAARKELEGALVTLTALGQSGAVLELLAASELENFDLGKSIGELRQKHAAELGEIKESLVAAIKAFGAAREGPRQGGTPADPKKGEGMLRFAKPLFEHLARLQDHGRLEGTIKGLIASAMPEASAEEQKAITHRAWHVLAHVSHEPNVDWRAIDDGLLSRIRLGETAATVKGHSLYGEQRWQGEFAALVGASFTSGNQIEHLKDGPTSFAKRHEIVERSTGPLYVGYWALYDDRTGKELTEALKKRAAEGLPVVVMVDGQTASAKKFDPGLEALAQAGAEVVRYENPKRPGEGFHAKFLMGTVDGKRVGVFGGRNPGDEYNDGGEGHAAWFDNDVVVRGPVLADADRFMVELVNAQAQGRPELHLASLREIDPKAPEYAANRGGDKALYIAHRPGPLGGDLKMKTAAMKLLLSARERYDIVNAYFIATPGELDAIGEAASRGVKVNVYTNSPMSADDPIVSVPILESAIAAYNKGANVYLRLGSTLHAKWDQGDGEVAMDMSYNYHKRSSKLEHENAMVSLNPELAQLHAKQLDDQIASGQAVRLYEKDGEFFVDVDGKAQKLTEGGVPKKSWRARLADLAPDLI